MTPGAYLRRCREASGKTIAVVAAELATEPRWAEHIRVELIDLIERDEQPASFATLVALSLAFPIDFEVLVCLTQDQTRQRDPRQPLRLPGHSSTASPLTDAVWLPMNQMTVGDQRFRVVWVRAADGRIARAYWTGKIWSHAPVEAVRDPLDFNPVAYSGPAESADA